MFVLLYLTLLFHCIMCHKCFKPDVMITQNIQNEGLHRDIKYLVEFSAENSDVLCLSDCKVALRQDVTAGAFVNPDQLSDLIRIKKVFAYVDGIVNVEASMHQSEPHTAYVYYTNNTYTKISLELPIHLRYQRAQITGGFGKVELPKPSLLLRCTDGSPVCGRPKKVEAPCDHRGVDTCLWNNISYKIITNDIEMMVPIGDLDHYPLVSIVTFLVACAGCIYILSVLSTTIL